MDIYLKILGNRILEVNFEEFDNYTKKINVKNYEDFLINMKEYQIEEEVQERVSQLFEGEESDDSLSKFNIKHWVSNRSFGELIDMYENDEIIKPEMQREFVWDSLKCSRLIESILLGLPIPPLFMLEVGNSKYELVDGFQRLNTLVNFVKGYPWSGKKNGKKNVAARLSKKVSKEIEGKTFNQLESEYQRIIKRSTIPLIEFKQLEPDNYNSKYLIFERINTGSEKLNPMQIRKSLAYGNFMNNLYEYANKNKKFIELFSAYNIKKDAHVEAFLRIIVMYKVYKNEFDIKDAGIINILNQYCEEHRNDDISEEWFAKFENSIGFLYDVFQKKDNICRRVIKNDQEQFIYTGSLNISILEAMVGILIGEYNKFDKYSVEEKYKNTMYEVIQKSLNNIESNPFSNSTGTKQAICSRFEICKGILIK